MMLGPQRRVAAVTLLAAVIATVALRGPAAADVPRDRLELCGSCHGDDGNSKTKKTPSLAGQPELFITNQLILMREKLRVSDAMAPFVKDLKDADITALAAHYAKQKPRPSPEPVDADLAERGVEVAKRLLCGSCHLPNYAGREHIPRLASQRIDYTIDSLIEYRAGKRYGIDTTMNGVMYGVSDAEIRALAHFLASVR